MVLDIDAALTRVAAELEEVSAQYEAVAAHLRELETMRDGLQLARERYGVSSHDRGTASEQEQVRVILEGAATEEDAATAAALPVASVGGKPPSFTAISFAALEALGGRAATNEVRDRAQAGGHKINHEQTRNALIYLLRSERIRRVSPGVWEIPRSPSPNGALHMAGVAVNQGVTQGQL